jgi:hypothetical protein
VIERGFDDRLRDGLPGNPPVTLLPDRPLSGEKPQEAQRDNSEREDTHEER